MKNPLVYLFLLLVLFGCDYSKEDLVGIYVKIPSVNTKDTLYLYGNGSYIQKVYFKTGELFGVNKNEWTIKDGKVDFINLYLNYDFDLNNYAKPKDGKIDEKSLMSSLLPIKSNRIIVDFDRQIYYQKIVK